MITLALFLLLAVQAAKSAQLECPGGGETRYDSSAGSWSGGQVPLPGYDSARAPPGPPHNIGKFLAGNEPAWTWLDEGKMWVTQNEITYEVYFSKHIKDYQLRITEPEPELCDPDVAQHSGYVDVTDGKHLFYWFFESRNDPSNAPLILWLNGGPGASSSFGLFLEVGPCSLTSDNASAAFNEFSWNTNANAIFLDQPVNVGFSYSTDTGNPPVDTSFIAGADVYAFLQLFLSRYPQYAQARFHIAAESYGGIYAPHFASIIHKNNKQLDSSESLSDGRLRINLESVVIGNGITSPVVQMGRIPDYACLGPYRLYDDPNGVECTSLRRDAQECVDLLKECARLDTNDACQSATEFCEDHLFGGPIKLGLNPYDLRQPCNTEVDGPICLTMQNLVEKWLNQADVKKSLGVDKARKFTWFSPDVNEAFVESGDAARNAASLIPEMLEDGVRLLIHVGNADYMCDYMGNEAWVEQMPSKFQDEFRASASKDWTTLSSHVVAGRVRSAGPGAGKLTFVEVFNAGHMVPHDQPAAALDLITRWLKNTPLTG